LDEQSANRYINRLTKPQQEHAFAHMKPIRVQQ